MERYRILPALFLCLALLTLSACSSKAKKATVYTGDEQLKMVSRVDGEAISLYADGKWDNGFLFGVNLGATTPGHHPGELSPSYDDYRYWFAGMSDLGVHSLRIYTILPPHFYKALADHNKATKNKLWLLQGIWSPEEELISLQDAYLPEITDKFHKEIALAVKAVYGLGEIPKTPGKAGGTYNTNVAPYLAAWILGSEWDPYMTDITNRNNPDKNQFTGRYFSTAAQASPFEAWLAESLDILATAEMEQGWQHPLSFVNWVTTDPLTHPDEPFAKEDMVSVDPLHVIPGDNWKAGYFAAYHVYPYYPDSLRFQQDYLEYQNKDGQNEPYEAYLLELKEKHPGMPLVIAEFGVPSSRGMAHRGSLDRNQGMHSEKEQGQMIVSMFKAMQNIDLAGGIVFSWHDEWFKHTWNTMDLEIPSDRRPMWLNRLTNEEHFGLLAVEPGSFTRIYLDGKIDDWKQINKTEKTTGGDKLKLTACSDEAYLYLAVENPAGWNWDKQELLIAFDNQPGGNEFLTQSAASLDIGAEFLLSVKNPRQAQLMVAGAYDQHTYLYGRVLKMIPFDESLSQENNGLFLPWKLCLSRELYLPASKRTIPFEEIEIGKLFHGNSYPDSPDYNSLSDYCCVEKLIEFRIPWMMLGFTDPSSHQVWAYPHRQHLREFASTTSPGINIQLLCVKPDRSQITYKGEVLSYNWENWDTPDYHERYKESYYILKSYIAGFE